MIRSPVVGTWQCSKPLAPRPVVWGEETCPSTRPCSWETEIGVGAGSMAGQECKVSSTRFDRPYAMWRVLLPLQRGLSMSLITSLDLTPPLAGLRRGVGQDPSCWDSSII